MHVTLCTSAELFQPDDRTRRSLLFQELSMFQYRKIAITAAILLISILVPGLVIAQSGPVAAYGFNEGAGTTVAGASGNANPGAISGATWNSSGKFGSALNFNGSSSLVTVAHKAS